MPFEFCLTVKYPSTRVLSFMLVISFWPTSLWWPIQSFSIQCIDFQLEAETKVLKCFYFLCWVHIGRKYNFHYGLLYINIYIMYLFGALVSVFISSLYTMGIFCGWWNFGDVSTKVCQGSGGLYLFQASGIFHRHAKHSSFIFFSAFNSGKTVCWTTCPKYYYYFIQALFEN